MASLEDLTLSHCDALANNDGTYAILSEMLTLTTLSLVGVHMKSLPERKPLNNL